MPQSVLKGRIVKRGQASRKQSQASTQLTIRSKAEKDGRAKQNKELASHKHKEAIKYYYLIRRYTLQKLYETMEIICKVGATSKQYSGYVDKCNFRKKLTKEEWESVAAYCYKSHAQGQEVAIKLNGQYILEPQTVRKELPRSLSLRLENGIRCQEVIIPPNSQWPLHVGQLELCIPTVDITVQRIPQLIWSRLPAWESQNSLLQICQRTCQQFGHTGMEIDRLANSNYFKYLKTLLYRLSNNLIDFGVLSELLKKVNQLGFRSSLKELLSLKTNTARLAAENILPLLIFQCDQDLLRHIFGVYNDLQRPAKCYEAMLQLQRPDLYKLLRSERVGFFSHMPDGFSNWTTLEDLVGASNEQAGKALANFIQLQQIVPSTLFEAAILVACAIDWELMPITTMKEMLPTYFNLGDVEEKYQAIFKQHIVGYKWGIVTDENSILLQNVLSHGFRRDMYMNALVAVLIKDYKTATCILSFTEINISAILCTGESGKVDDSRRNGCLAGTLGLEGFSHLVSATAQEQYNQNCDWDSNSIRNLEIGLLSSSLAVACYHSTYESPGGEPGDDSEDDSEDDSGDDLGDRTGLHIRLRDIEIVNILTGALVEIIDIDGLKIDPWYKSFRDDFYEILSEITFFGREGALEQCQNLVMSGAEIGGSTQVSFRNSGSSYEKSTVLNYAVSFLHLDLVRVLLELNADPDLEDYKGRTPIIILLIILTLKSNRDFEEKCSRACKKEEFGRILDALLRAGARFPTTYERIPWGENTAMQDQNDWKEYFSFQDLEDRFQPEFMTALRTGDIDQIDSLWDGEFGLRQPEHPDTCEPCSSCEYLINTFDQAFGETGGWRGSKFITKLCWHDPRIIGDERCLLMIGDEVELLERFILYHPIDTQAEISTSLPGEMTLLELAAKNERAKSLLLLLQNGCDLNEDVNPPGLCSISALSYAVTNGHLEIGKTLLEYGADIYKIPGTNDPKRFLTPVEFAVELRRLDFIALSLLHSIECRDIALAAAEKCGHKTIAKWIKDEWMPKPLDPTNSPRDLPTYDIENHVHEWCYE
ncbi:hypothetical protein TWF751_001562 [Orbilia oligospora]|nr:hypothetical protein TWF751_001562 [Orbilia oligospora]